MPYLLKSLISRLLAGVVMLSDNTKFTDQFTAIFDRNTARGVTSPAVSSSDDAILSADRNRKRQNEPEVNLI